MKISFNFQFPSSFHTCLYNVINSWEKLTLRQHASTCTLKYCFSYMHASSSQQKRDYEELEILIFFRDNELTIRQIISVPVTTETLISD